MVWFTGETISEAINNGFKKYGAAYFDGVQPASSLPTFKRYAEKWFPLYHVPKVKPNTAIMGHADIETTLDRYTHAQEERIRAAGELLTGKFKSSDS